MRLEIADVKLLHLPLSSLKKLQGSLKILTEENRLKLEREIIENKFKVPFFIWVDPSSGDNYILDGHQREATLQGMIQKDYEIPELPCLSIPADSYEDAKKTLLAITSSYGEITQSGMQEFLKDVSFDFEEVKDKFTFRNEEFVFEQKKKVEFEAGDKKKDDDEVPEVQPDPITQLGDIWLLGDHRIMCGDSTKKENIDKLMKGEKIDMVFTDPPKAQLIGI